MTIKVKGRVLLSKEEMNQSGGDTPQVELSPEQKGIARMLGLDPQETLETYSTRNYEDSRVPASEINLQGGIKEEEELSLEEEQEIATVVASLTPGQVEFGQRMNLTPRDLAITIIDREKKKALEKKKYNAHAEEPKKEEPSDGKLYNEEGKRVYRAWEVSDEEQAMRELVEKDIPVPTEKPQPGISTAEVRGQAWKNLPPSQWNNITGRPR